MQYNTSYFFAFHHLSLFFFLVSLLSSSVALWYSVECGNLLPGKNRLIKLSGKIKRETEKERQRQGSGAREREGESENVFNNIDSR